MRVFWQSTGPAGFSSHTETQPTLSLLVKNDGGYALTYGCKKVIVDGNIRLERYYEPSEIKLLIAENHDDGEMIGISLYQYYKNKEKKGERK